MAQNTAIEWCDATFNPWIGCTKVSPACDHCYAEADMDLRRHRVRWGAGQPRSRTSLANWRQPLRWNQQRMFQCSGCGWRGVVKYGTTAVCGTCEKPADQVRMRVFCASLADVFDNEVDPQWRADLFDLIAATPNLDWLLLTKRIGNVAAMVPGTWRPRYPGNVRIGITVCNHEEARRDIPKLLRLPAANFLSIEPLLGPITFGPYTLLDQHCFVCGAEDACNEPRGAFSHPINCAKRNAHPGDRNLPTGVEWVIAGGESGASARPMHPDWVRSLRDQCADAGVPFLFKQWGEWEPREEWSGLHLRTSPRKFERMTAVMPDGSPCPDDAVPQDVGAHRMALVGKKAAGRLLDGVEHNGFPEVPRG